MENLKRSVTIPLDDYEQMKNELKKLRLEVEKKTIIKHELHPFYFGLAIIAVLIQFFFLRSHI